MKLLELLKSRKNKEVVTNDIKTKENQGLGEKVCIYIPSTVDINKEMDTGDYIKECAILLSSLFGGATSQQVTGYWQSNTHGLVKENITIVYAFAEKMTEDNLETIVQFCDKLKAELSQEAISLEVNGRLRFI